MKIQIRLIALALSVGAALPAVHAAERKNAASFSGNIQSAKGDTSANITGRYERLFWKKTSIEGLLSYDKTKNDGTSIDAWVVGVGVTQYVLGDPLRESKLLGYGKAVLAFVHATGSETDNGVSKSGSGNGTVLGLFGGLEQPLGESVSLFEELGYQRTKISDKAAKNAIVLNFGIKLRY
jgi:hypothetical protein